MVKLGRRQPTEPVQALMFADVLFVLEWIEQLWHDHRYAGNIDVDDN